MPTGPVPTPGPAPTPAPEVEGPPLTGGPVPVLPFPGSVTVKCTFDARQPQTCMPDDKPGVTVQATGELTVERSETVLDETGCPSQTLSIRTSLQLGPNAQAGNTTASGSLASYLGQAVNYELTVSPQAADAIGAGSRPAPNPVDPSTIAQGESIQLTQEFYSGIGAEASYRALQLEMGYDEGTRVSSAVTRISPTSVRVTVGDADFVRQTLGLGLGFDGFGVGLSNTKDLSSGNLHAVDIDISTPDGWNTYQTFLSTGKLPQSGTAGTTNPTQAKTIAYSSATEIGAELGPLGVGGVLNDSEGHITDVTNPDGSIDRVTTARDKDVGLVDSRRVDANGNLVGAPTRSLQLHDVHPSLVSDLYQVTGQTPPAAVGSDLRLTFSEPQLELIRQAALERLADKVAVNGERPTPEQIAASLADRDGVVEFNDVQYDFGGLETLLGAAQTPDDILLALYYGGLEADNVLYSLTDLLRDRVTNLGPIIETPSC